MATTPHAVIVVADDDPETNDFVSALLAGEGYRVLSCATGQEALQVAAHLRPDAVPPEQASRQLCESHYRQHMRHQPGIRA